MLLEQEANKQRGPVENLSILRSALLKYLCKGMLDCDYKEGNNPYVLEPVVRDMALRAGYTEFALSCLGGMGYTDLVESGKWPQEPREKFTVKVYAPNTNRYGLEVGCHDGIRAVRWVAQTQQPDLPEGDLLRDSVLERLSQFDALRQDLQESGKRWLSLESWHFHLDGSMDYWLNPMDQLYSAGCYSQDDLRSWLNDDPKSPVLKANQDKLKQQKKPGRVKTYRDYYMGELTKLVDGGGVNSRLLTIALMGCPFPELVAQYLPEG